MLQIGIDLLRMNPKARLLIANVEMVPSLLLERVVSRLACLSLTSITNRTLSPKDFERMECAKNSLAPMMNRLAFLNGPFALEYVAVSGTEFQADVLALDCIQRFSVGDATRDKQEQLETAAALIRRLCDIGALDSWHLLWHVRKDVADPRIPV